MVSSSGMTGQRQGEVFWRSLIRWGSGVWYIRPVFLYKSKLIQISPGFEYDWCLGGICTVYLAMNYVSFETHGAHLKVPRFQAERRG